MGFGGVTAGAAGAAWPVAGLRARPAVSAVAATEADLTNSLREIGSSLFMAEVLSQWSTMVVDRIEKLAPH
jgi:hypothetical protein